MNKIIAILIVLIVLIFIAAGAVWFMRSKAPATSGTDGVPSVTIPPDSNSSGTSQQTSQSKSSVQAAFKNSLGSNNPDYIVPTDTVIVGNYALQSWKGQITGGEALMKYDSTTGRWNLVMSTGGSWSEQELVTAGVSQTVASQLVTGAGN